MSQLKQIQIAYSPVEDRLLLRINTAEKEEYRFWITRRYLKILWQAVSGLLVENPQVRTQLSMTAKQAVLSFQHEKAVSEADFSKSFDESAQALPLGTAPVLLARIHTRPGPEGNKIIGMHPESAQGVELAVNDEILHGISRLVSDAATKAGWDMEFLKKTGTEVLAAELSSVN